MIIEITDCDLGLEYFKFRKQPLAAGEGFIACTESTPEKACRRIMKPENNEETVGLISCFKSVFEK